jgi:N-acetylglucosaminyldiphosphoundecaprenol N-acetyl-beta-D-mannosaminyltransferase
MFQVFGIRFSPNVLADLGSSIVSESIPEGAGPRLLVTANVDHVVQLRANVDFRAAYASAWAVTIDGFRVFFIANSEKTADGLRRWLLDRGFPEDSIGISVPPFGFERHAEHSRDLAARIRQHRATHLFVGVGAPKSEIWCHQHRHLLGDCYVLCVGAGLEFFLGLRKRAPVIMRKVGMEWLWRFGQEPRRLFRRYFLESWQFVIAMVDDLQGRSNKLWSEFDVSLSEARPGDHVKST